VIHVTFSDERAIYLDERCYIILHRTSNGRVMTHRGGRATGLARVRVSGELNGVTGRAAGESMQPVAVLHVLSRYLSGAQAGAAVFTLRT